ncbi:MAG: hypothetical protein CMK07_07675 [Ponticaulis sp.]|nr:hypothetical protein [Ponticaulis sp.]
MFKDEYSKFERVQTTDEHVYQKSEENLTTEIGDLVGVDLLDPILDPIIDPILGILDMVTSNITDELSNVAVGVNFVFEFDGNIEAGLGVITLINHDTNESQVISMDDEAVSILDDTLTLDLAQDLDFGTEYSITIDEDAIVGVNGEEFGGITEGEMDFSTEVQDGTNGDDEIDGTEGRDKLIGRKGDDMLSGEGGNDVLSGRDGDDNMHGGDGNDTFVGGEGFDSHDGGEGKDTVSYRCATEGLLLNLANMQRSTGDAAGDTYISIEKFYLSCLDDRLVGSDVRDVVVLDEGDDIALGRGGNDSLSGGDGNDLLYGGEGNDRLFTGEGDDILEGGNGNDYLLSQGGNNILTGGQGDDIFAFMTSDTGTHTITDFDANGNDKIAFIETGLPLLDLLDLSNALDLLSLLGINVQTNGNNLMLVSDANTIEMENVSIDDLSLDNFLLM